MEIDVHVVASQTQDSIDAYNTFTIFTVPGNKPAAELSLDFRSERPCRFRGIIVADDDLRKPHERVEPADKVCAELTLVGRIQSRHGS